MTHLINCFNAKSTDVNRLYPELTQSYRDNFQKDRDRILYSKSFRRLSGKTQVFLAGQNDHLRTRLTHTLEVNQIAKTISSALNLNLDLTEAIALGHDIGHTPFGHIGERTLNFIMNGCESINDFNSELPDNLKGFKHNLQALRILTQLEASKEEYVGLNMTNYTLWGIVNHTKTKNFECKRTTFNGERNHICECYYDHTIKDCPQNGLLLLDFYKDNLQLVEESTSWTFEALVVRIADEIAQRHHDIEDGIQAGLIDKSDIIDIIKTTFSKYLDENKKIAKSFKELENLKTNELLSSYVSRFIVNFLVMQVIEDTKSNIKLLSEKYQFKTSNDFHTYKKVIFKDEDVYNLVNYNDGFQEKEKEFQKFLKNKILNSYVAQKMDGKAEFIIRKLFQAFVSNPQQLPDRTLMYFFNSFLGKAKVMQAQKKYTEKNLIGGLRGELKSNYERNDNPRFKHVLLRTICDYISGMTDNYAYNQFELLYGSTRVYHQ